VPFNHGVEHSDLKDSPKSPQFRVVRRRERSHDPITHVHMRLLGSKKGPSEILGQGWKSEDFSNGCNKVYRLVRLYL
jgi:hypothetical protein